MKALTRVSLGFAILFSSACALFEDRPGPPRFSGPREQVYSASYDEVWKAVNLVLQPYPLRVSNMDQGVLETDAIHVEKLWTLPYRPPDVNDTNSSGENYRLVVRVIKGSADKHGATKVNILKEIMNQRDFFSEPKPVMSDGMEEKSILYRISREIVIERALVRSQQRVNQKKPVRAK